jgi:hypothetical protein
MGSIRSIEVLSIYYCSDDRAHSGDMHYIHPTRSPGFGSIPQKEASGPRSEVVPYTCGKRTNFGIWGVSSFQRIKMENDETETNNPWNTLKCLCGLMLGGRTMHIDKSCRLLIL